MTKITEEQVRHIAKLARLHLRDDEVTKFSKQLSAVFDYIELLNEVDTADVDATSQVTGLQNVIRNDELDRFCEPQDLLKCSPLPIQRDQIRVKPVIES